MAISLQGSALQRLAPALSGGQYRSAEPKKEVTGQSPVTREKISLTDVSAAIHPLVHGACINSLLIGNALRQAIFYIAFCNDKRQGLPHCSQDPSQKPATARFAAFIALAKRSHSWAAMRGFILSLGPRRRTSPRGVRARCIPGSVGGRSPRGLACLAGAGFTPSGIFDLAPRAKGAATL